MKSAIYTLSFILFVFVSSSQAEVCSDLLLRHQQALFELFTSDGSPQTLETLARDRMNRVPAIVQDFETRAKRRDVSFHKTEFPVDGLLHRLEFTAFKNVISDFNPKTDLVIGVRQSDYLDNGKWMRAAFHAYMVTGRWRFDGGPMGQVPYEPNRAFGLEKGIAFVFRHVPPEEIQHLSDVIAAKPQIRDLSCYNALFTLLTENSNFILKGVAPAIPSVPSEYIELLLKGALGRKDGRELPMEVVNIGNVDIREILTTLVQWENDSMPIYFSNYHQSVPSSPEALENFDYRAALGWR